MNPSHDRGQAEEQVFSLAWGWLVASGADLAVTPSTIPSPTDRKSLNPSDQWEVGTLPGPLFRDVPHSVPGYPVLYCPDTLQVLAQGLNSLGRLSW